MILLRRKSPFTVLTLMIMVCVNIFYSSGVAHAGAFGGLGPYVGYFDQGSTTGGGQVISSGVAVNSLPAFVQRLKDAKLESARNATGVDFLVRSMTGYGPGAPRGVTDADIDALGVRLSQPGISIVWNEVGRPIAIDTYGTVDDNSGRRDVTQDDVGTWSNSIVISYNGVVQYVIQRWCANPDGALSNPIPLVPVDYNLSPQTNSAGSSRVVVESGSNVPNITYQVAKSGGAANSKPTNWQLARCTYNPSYAPTTDYTDAAADNNSDAVTTYTARGGTCTQANSGTGTIFSANPTVLGTVTTDTTGNLAVGSRICYVLSVSPPTHTAALTVWRHSVPVCIVIAKQPKVQVLGGDLRATGRVQSSLTTKSVAGMQTTFGSWVEYGIFATGTVTRTASGATIALGMVGSTACNRAPLTFTNAGTSTCVAAGTTIGQYTSPRSLPDVVANFPSAGVAINTGILSANGPDALLGSPGVYIGSHTGNLTVGASTLQPGKTVVLKVSGTVTITGNQTYNPDNNGVNYTNIAQLPQLVIIANKIVIDNAVTNVDAWLVANGVDGVVETCDVNSSSFALSGNQRLTVNACSNPLTVNGPVIAKQLWLRRTAGSTPAASGAPAEVFNLRADAYLWSKAYANSNGRVQTVYTTELPPRL